MKRVAGFVLILPLLYLNVQRADVACASHDRAPDASAMATHHAGTDAHAHAPSSHAGTQSAEDEACDVPAQRDCCHAVASCSVALDFDDGVGDSGAELTSVAVASATSTLPRSRVAPPDPPPPRA